MYRLTNKLGLIAVTLLALIVVVLFMRRVPATSPGDRTAVRIVDTGYRPPHPRVPNPTPTVAAGALTADPVSDVVSASSPVVQDRHARLDEQVHDEATARAEQRLGSAMPAGLRVLASGGTTRVNCSDRMCELFGEVSDAPDVVRRDLENALWLDTLPRLGYVAGPASVVAQNGKTRFLYYLDRKTASSAR